MTKVFSIAILIFLVVDPGLLARENFWVNPGLNSVTALAEGALL